MKNKYLYALIFIISIYMLGISLFSAFDFIRYREYVSKNPYFNSYSYKNDLREYFENIRLLVTDFKGYSQKTDNEKLSEKEIQDLTKNYEASLSNKQSTVENQYKNSINEAQKQGDKAKAEALEAEKSKKLEEMKKDNNKALEDLKREAIEKKDMIYENLQNSLKMKNSIKYYLKDKKSGAVYTNLENSADLGAFIKKQAIYEESFPRSSVVDVNLRTINSWFQANNFEGKFIFLKDIDGFSQMEENYKYYNSIRERVIQEGILFIFITITGLILLIYLSTRIKAEYAFLEKTRKLYERIPLDLRTHIFIVYSLIMWIYLGETVFFYKPIGISQVFKLTTVSVYILYLLLNVKYVIYLIKKREELDKQWKNSISYQLWYLIRESFKAKGILSQAGILFSLTTLFGIFLSLEVYAVARNAEGPFMLASAYILLYLIVVPMYILKRVVRLNKIIKGTDEIVSGNLNYTLEETGNNVLSRLAHNINNMRDGFKRSVEGQLRSERLKTELITNVSHDLKTPLTSIINYVNLLKKGELSGEQQKNYIDVLDKKSQRLKVLIEDLFEASKMSSGAVELNIERVDISALLRQALGEFDEKISNSPLIFKVNIPIDEVYLNLDGKRTWRVFENLIGNALKYSQPNSRVYIDMIEQDDAIKIIMKNMSAYEMDFNVEEIFERFKRGDKARSTEGSGLGLSIAKSIVELQGGRMHIDIDGDLFKVTVEFRK